MLEESAIHLSASTFALIICQYLVNYPVFFFWSSCGSGTWQWSGWVVPGQRFSRSCHEDIGQGCGRLDFSQKIHFWGAPWHGCGQVVLACHPLNLLVTGQLRPPGGVIWKRRQGESCNDLYYLVPQVTQPGLLPFHLLESSQSAEPTGGRDEGWSFVSSREGYPIIGDHILKPSWSSLIHHGLLVSLQLAQCARLHQISSLARIRCAVPHRAQWAGEEHWRYWDFMERPEEPGRVLFICDSPLGLLIILLFFLASSYE